MGTGVFSCCDAISATKATEFEVPSSKHNLTLKDPPLMSSNFLPSYIQNHSEFVTPNLDEHVVLLQNLTSSKSLRLKVINSGNILKGTTLNIRATGLVGSKRNVSDGYTYFGTKKKMNNQVVNDFIIPLKDNESNDKHRGKQFVIYYRIDKDSY